MTAGMFQIEKDVPPPVYLDRGRPARYPVADMVVGDSFKFPVEFARQVRAATFRVVKKHPDRKFSVRQEESHMRCWRVT